MRQFGLIFSISDSNDVYIAPQYLAEECPDNEKLDMFRRGIDMQHSFTLRFLSILPSNIFLRFISKHGSKSQSKLFWKYEIYFFEEDMRVWASYNMASNTIRVYIQGGDKTIASNIFNTIKNIVGSNDFQIILEGEQPILWSELVRNRNKLKPLLIAKYRHLLQQSELDMKNNGSGRTGYDVVPNLKKTKKQKVFISYSKEDDILRGKLVKFLKQLKRSGNVETWYDREMIAGTVWDDKIKSELHSADIVLCLVSSDFLATDYIMDEELPIMLEREEKGLTKVIPVILRPCAWQDTMLAKFQALLGKDKPLTLYDNQDVAFMEIYNGLKKVIEST